MKESDVDDLRAVLVRIAERFNLSEGEADLIRAHNTINLYRAMKALTEQLTPEDFEWMTEDDLLVLRRHGYKTPEEIAAGLELKDLTFESFVVYVLFKKTRPFTSFELKLDSIALYKEITENTIDEQIAKEAVDAIVELFSDPNVGYIYQVEDGQYDLNPMATIGEKK